MRKKIYKENSSDLGFAISCLYSQAIHRTEFRQWIKLCITELAQNDIPLYMFDLLNFDDFLYKINQIIGFVPSPEMSETEKIALEGISYLRGIDIYDPIAAKETAINCLQQNPQILEQFRKNFPFIILKT